MMWGVHNMNTNIRHAHNFNFNFVCTRRLGWKDILTLHHVFIPVWIWPGFSFAPPQRVIAEINHWGLHLYWSLLVLLLALDLSCFLSRVKGGFFARLDRFQSLEHPFASSSWQHSLCVLWLAVCAALHLPDSTRWEPFQVVLVALMTCFAALPLRQLHLLVPAWQHISISMYFFAGLGKINVDFVEYIVPRMIQTIVRPLVIPPSLLRAAQHAVPLFETLIPVVLLLMRGNLPARRTLAFMLVAMHVVCMTLDSMHHHSLCWLCCGVVQQQQ